MCNVWYGAFTVEIKFNKRKAEKFLCCNVNNKLISDSNGVCSLYKELKKKSKLFASKGITRWWKREESVAVLIIGS